MIITSVTSSSGDYLLSKLETNGLSASKAQLVENDLSQVSDSSGTSGSVDMATMRAALDKKIDQDVASGALSDSDATAVKKTLDQIDGQTGGTSGATQTATTDPTTAASQTQGGTQAQSGTDTSTQAAGAARAEGGGGGGGGGSASSAKTEVSETETINGPLMTTIITYSDGSTETLTTVATPADELKYGKQSPLATATTIAQNYLSTLQPGTLFNQLV